MRTLKYLILFICLLLFTNNITVANNTTEMFPVHVHGKAGAVLKPDGSYKLCPGASFNRCATIYVTLRDLWNLVFSNNGSSDANITFNVVATLYDEYGNTTNTLYLEGKLVNPALYSSESDLESLTEDDIILR